MKPLSVAGRGYFCPRTLVNMSPQLSQTYTLAPGIHATLPEYRSSFPTAREFPGHDAVSPQDGQSGMADESKRHESTQSSQREKKSYHIIPCLKMKWVACLIIILSHL